MRSFSEAAKRRNKLGVDAPALRVGLGGVDISDSVMSGTLVVYRVMLFPGYGLEVSGVNASRILAKMMKDFAFGDRPDVLLVKDAMRAAASPHMPVAVNLTPLPYPTRRFISTVFDYVGGLIGTFMVSRHVANVLSLKMPHRHMGCLSQGSDLAAAAQAKLAGIRRYPVLEGDGPFAVSFGEMAWLSLAPSVFTARPAGNLGLLSAAAPTVAIGHIGFCFPSAAISFAFLSYILHWLHLLCGCRAAGCVSTVGRPYYTGVRP